MTIKKDDDEVLISGDLELIVLEGTPITIKLEITTCTEYQILESNDCKYCGVPLYYDIKTKVCQSCLSPKLTYDGKACVEACSDINLGSSDILYKEDSTCVEKCSDSHTLNDKKDECLLVKTVDDSDDTSASLYGNKLLVLVLALLLFA